MHSKEILQNAGFLWVSMLVKVIQREDNEGATFSSIFEAIKQLDQSHGQMLESWLEQAVKKQRMPGNINIGWAKIAWTYGIRELHQLASSKEKAQLDHNYFKNTMREIILEAGDTDTNAAIVGGLLGSLIGFSCLPGEYIDKMLELVFP